LDGILAREIAFEGKRGEAFLYLRALSLHLRGRDKEALDFIHEALLLDMEVCLHLHFKSAGLIC
jgi:hypothetical protein